MVKLTTKPLQPTSTDHSLTFQPSACLFCSNATSRASSHGTVNFTIKTQRQDMDQRTRSIYWVGRWASCYKVHPHPQILGCVQRAWVWKCLPVRRFSLSRMKVIFRGKVVWSFRGLALVATLLFSSTAAKHFSTWLWRQVYLPQVSLVLQSRGMW